MIIHLKMFTVKTDLYCKLTGYHILVKKQNINLTFLLQKQIPGQLEFGISIKLSLQSIRSTLLKFIYNKKYI